MNAIFILNLLLPIILLDLESGLKAGEKAPETKVYSVEGEHKEKTIDIVKERGELPTVYLFVNSEKFDRPIARYMRELDIKCGDGVEKVTVVAIWVNGDTDKNKEYLPKVFQSLKFNRTTLAIPDGEKVPSGWGLNLDANLTAIIVHQGKVLKSFAYQSTNEKDVPAVVDELKKAK